MIVVLVFILIYQDDDIDPRRKSKYCPKEMAQYEKGRFGQPGGNQFSQKTHSRKRLYLDSLAKDFAGGNSHRLVLQAENRLLFYLVRRGEGGRCGLKDRGLVDLLREDFDWCLGLRYKRLLKDQRAGLEVVFFE